MKKYAFLLVLIMSLILITGISSSQRFSSSQVPSQGGGGGGGVIAPPPAACTGPCTTPGQYCCWYGTNGAFQNSCRGDDGCTTGCVWGPAVSCGVGSICTPKVGIGSKCKFTRLISDDGWSSEENEQLYSIIFGENILPY